MADKVLIRAPNHLGDCLMALPMINETREAYPGSTVTVLAPEHLTVLYELNPAVDHVLAIPTEHVHGLIGVIKIKDIIAPHAFDVSYILPPSFGAAAGFKLAGIKQRIGYVTDGRRLLLSKPLPLPTPLSSTHRSEIYFNLLRRATGADVDFVRPKLFLNEKDTAGAEEILSRFGVGENRPYAVLAVRAVAESRRWGLSKYTDLAKRLISSYGLKVVLVGSSGDARDADTVVSSAGARDVVNLAGKTGLRESAALITCARFFVGNDSGPAHLAAAVGIPLVVLSGADQPKETSPLSPRKQLIYLDHLDCISCVKNICPLKNEDHMRCMTEITVDMVTNAIDKLLRSAD